MYSGCGFSPLPSKTWIVLLDSSVTASNGKDAPRRWTQQTQRGLNCRVYMASKSVVPGPSQPLRKVLYSVFPQDLPNVITSKIFTVLSVPAVAKLLPSALTLVLLTSPVCARNSLTNSTPTAIFFQNLTNPSIELVIKKSVCGDTVTKDNWSLCISDFEYRGDAGSAFT